MCVVGSGNSWGVAMWQMEMVRHPPPHSDSWEGQISEGVWVARGLPAGHPGGHALLKE